MTELDLKIPKQMRHWFNRAGIYQPKYSGSYRQWRRHNYLFAETKKKIFTNKTRDGERNFRILPHLDRMDICDGHFDRWANSLGASVPMPKTEAEFKQALVTLVQASRIRVLETHEVLSFDILV